MHVDGLAIALQDVGFEYMFADPDNPRKVSESDVDRLFEGPSAPPRVTSIARSISSNASSRQATPTRSRESSTASLRSFSPDAEASSPGRDSVSDCTKNCIHRLDLGDSLACLVFCLVPGHCTLG